MTRGSGGCSAGLTRTVTQITATTPLQFFNALSDIKLGDEIFFERFSNSDNTRRIDHGNMHCISNNGTTRSFVGVTIYYIGGSSYVIGKKLNVTTDKIYIDYLSTYGNNMSEVNMTFASCVNAYKIIYT